MDVRHPARYSKALLPVMAEMLEGCTRVLDPFAGVGGIHALATTERRTVGLEIEPEWAYQSANTLWGDARNMPETWTGIFDAVCTSPAYGNRMADSHNARDSSKRVTYTHTLGHSLSDGNSGGMQWGGSYKALHREVWGECWRVLEPGGKFVLNCKNHIRNGVEIPVTEWHSRYLEALGFREIRREIVPLRGNGFGANGKVRVAGEWVILFEKGA